MIEIKGSLKSYINCPICESNMQSITANYKICNNGCYRIRKVGNLHAHYVFGKEHTFLYSPYEKREVKLREEIAYWKENDRYLAEILSKE